MKVFIKKHPHFAGFWIYNGYASAWKSLGYDVYFYNNLSELNRFNDFILMATDSSLKNEDVDVFKKSFKTFLFTQPDKFPKPWGGHPNFVTQCSDDLIDQINQIDKVKQWTFCNVDKQFFTKFNPKTVPLAFDSINYSLKNSNKIESDVCYIGGFADNGFNEKAKIINETLGKLSGYKTSFYVNKNISHEHEIKVMNGSKICLNIHDQYQKTLQLDTNERTFKAIGVNGILLTDKNEQISSLFRDKIKYFEYNDSNICQKIDEIKQHNTEFIKNNHSYINRVKELMEL